jgi:hypothetical protein
LVEFPNNIPMYYNPLADRRVVNALFTKLAKKNCFLVGADWI